MTKVDVLDRVAADLSHGHTHQAIQRLSSLVAAHPADLDLRRRLAAVQRDAGNPTEAGRWGYLEPGGDPAEVAAFERRYPDPAQRLRRLRWPSASTAAPTEFARARLAGLAEVKTVESSPHRGSGLPWVLLVIVALVAAGLAVLGAVTVGQWVAG